MFDFISLGPPALVKPQIICNDTVESGMTKILIDTRYLIGFAIAFFCIYAIAFFVIKSDHLSGRHALWASQVNITLCLVSIIYLIYFLHNLTQPNARWLLTALMILIGIGLSMITLPRRCPACSNRSMKSIFPPVGKHGAICSRCVYRERVARKKGDSTTSFIDAYR